MNKQYHMMHTFTALGYLLIISIVLLYLLYCIAFGLADTSFPPGSYEPLK